MKNIPHNGHKVYVFVGACAVLGLVLLWANCAFAAEHQDTAVLDNIALKIQTTASTWFPILQAQALRLFRWLLIIDVVWMGIQLVLKRAELYDAIVDFIRLLLFAAFMYALVIYFKDWANSLISGLGTIANTQLNAPVAEPGYIFEAGLIIVKTAYDAGSIMSPVDSLAWLICGIIICVVFSLIAAQVLLVKCEAYIVLNAGAILLGFGGSKFTKDYATNFLRYALAIAVKLFVMQLLVSIGMEFVDDFRAVEPDLNELIVVIGASIVLLALTMSIPDIVSGIVNGSHVSTGQAITSATTAVATSTMAAMGAMKAMGANTAGGAQALRGASQFADAAGATGVGKYKHMAGTLANAAKAARNPGTMDRINSAVRANYENFKMDQDDSGSENK